MNTHKLTYLQKFRPNIKNIAATKEHNWWPYSNMIRYNYYLICEFTLSIGGITFHVFTVNLPQHVLCKNSYSMNMGCSLQYFTT